MTTEIGKPTKVMDNYFLFMYICQQCLKSDWGRSYKGESPASVHDFESVKEAVYCDCCGEKRYYIASYPLLEMSLTPELAGNKHIPVGNDFEDFAIENDLLDDASDAKEENTDDRHLVK